MRFCIKNGIMHLDGSFACFTKNCLTMELFFMFKKKNQNSVKKAWTINLCLQVFICYSPKDSFKKTKQKTTNKPTQKTTRKSQEPLDHLLSQFLLYFLVQEHEAGIYAASCFP